MSDSIRANRKRETFVGFGIDFKGIEFRNALKTHKKQ